MIRRIEGSNAEVFVYTGEGGIDAVPRDVLRVRVDPSVTKVPGVDKDEVEDEDKVTMMTCCCAECGGEELGGIISLKTCKACMDVKYCNADCQKNHWPKHKKECKQRAAELRDEMLFKDPPAKVDCPICFLPMPVNMIACVTLPPATKSSVPIHDFAEANEELAKEPMEEYYPCCGKSICTGCIYSIAQSGNDDKFPFCNSDRNNTDEEQVAEMMKRVVANDPVSMGMLGSHYEHGLRGLQQDETKGMELYARAAALGSSMAHNYLADNYYKGENSKKAKFHYEAAAMAGHEAARFILGSMEAQSGNVERAVKHWMIAASAGNYAAMHNLLVDFNQGSTSRESINATLAAYNKSCIEMRSEARDAAICLVIASNM